MFHDGIGDVGGEAVTSPCSMRRRASSTTDDTVAPRWDATTLACR